MGSKNKIIYFFPNWLTCHLNNVFEPIHGNRNFFYRNLVQGIVYLVVAILLQLLHFYFPIQLANEHMGCLHRLLLGKLWRHHSDFQNGIKTIPITGPAHLD